MAREDKQLKNGVITRTERDKGRERRRETARESEAGKKKEVFKKERGRATDARGGRYNERERERQRERGREKGRRDEERLFPRSGVLDRGNEERKKITPRLSYWDKSDGDIYEHFFIVGKTIDKTTVWRELKDTENKRAFYNTVTMVIRRKIPHELELARARADTGEAQTGHLLGPLGCEVQEKAATGTRNTPFVTSSSATNAPCTDLLRLKRETFKRRKYSTKKASHHR